MSKEKIVDDNEYSSIYEKYIDALYAYGLSLTNNNKDDCLDAIHDVFIQFYFKHKHKIEEGENVKGYLFKSLRNRIIDISRHLQKEIETSNMPQFEARVDETADSQLLEDEERKRLGLRVQKLLSILTPRQREIIYLRYMQEMEYEEIAKIMDINADSVRKQVARAIKTIREHFHIDTLTAIGIMLAFSMSSSYH